MTGCSGAPLSSCLHHASLHAVLRRRPDSPLFVGSEGKVPSGIHTWMFRLVAVGELCGQVLPMCAH